MDGRKGQDFDLSSLGLSVSHSASPGRRPRLKYIVHYVHVILEPIHELIGYEHLPCTDGVMTKDGYVYTGIAAGNIKHRELVIPLRRKRRQIFI